MLNIRLLYNTTPHPNMKRGIVASAITVAVIGTAGVVYAVNARVEPPKEPIVTQAPKAVEEPKEIEITQEEPKAVEVPQEAPKQAQKQVLAPAAAPKSNNPHGWDDTTWLCVQDLEKYIPYLMSAGEKERTFTLIEKANAYYAARGVDYNICNIIDELKASELGSRPWIIKQPPPKWMNLALNVDMEIWSYYKGLPLTESYV